MISEMGTELEKMREQIKHALAALETEKRELASMENLVRKERRQLRPKIRQESSEETEARGRERELYTDDRKLLQDLKLQSWTELDIIHAIEQIKSVHKKMEAEYMSVLKNIEHIMGLCNNNQIIAKHIQEARALFVSNARIITELRKQLGIEASKETKVSGEIRDDEAEAARAERDLEAAKKEIQNSEKVIHLR